jgi:hypothetical protein
MFWKSSAEIPHFISIKQKTWLQHTTPVSDWPIYKKNLETTWPIRTKLCRNDVWKVLSKNPYFVTKAQKHAVIVTFCHVELPPLNIYSFWRKNLSRCLRDWKLSVTNTVVGNVTILSIYGAVSCVCQSNLEYPEWNSIRSNCSVLKLAWASVTHQVNPLLINMLLIWECWHTGLPMSVCALS